MYVKTLGSLLVVSSMVLNAHDMYLMPSGFRPSKDTLLTIGIHTGDSFPDSDVAGKLDKLDNPRLLWNGGSAPITNFHSEKQRNVGEVRVPVSGTLIIAASTRPTLIELEPPKFLSYLKEEGLTNAIEWRDRHSESSKPGKERYSKYAKSLVVAGQSDEFFRHRVGYIIEIIPEADPAALNAAGQLPIQVLFRGKPAADLQIETSWAGAAGVKTVIVGRTDANGRLRVPVSGVGRWRIHTIRMERCADTAAADWESFWASLTFEVRSLQSRIQP